MNKKALILDDTRRSMKTAMSDIGAHSSNIVFGKYVKPLQKFISTFSRRVFVLLEVQNEEMDALKTQVHQLEQRVNQLSGNAA